MHLKRNAEILKFYVITLDRILSLFFKLTLVHLALFTIYNRLLIIYFRWKESTIRYSTKFTAGLMEQADSSRKGLM